MTIFVYKKLTRNPEIANTQFWVLPNIWRPRQIRDIKFGRNTLLKCSRMHKNVRFPAFTVSELLRENEQGRVTLRSAPTQIKIKLLTYTIYLRIMNQLWHSFVCPWSIKINKCVKLGVRISSWTRNILMFFLKTYLTLFWLGCWLDAEWWRAGVKNFSNKYSTSSRPWGKWKSLSTIMNRLLWLRLR